MYYFSDSAKSRALITLAKEKISQYNKSMERENKEKWKLDHDLQPT